MMPFHKILFPVDFSEAAVAMVPNVTEVAQRFNAAVTVLNAFDLVRDYILARSPEAPCDSEPTAIPYTPALQEFRRQREQRLEEFSRTQFVSINRTARIEDGDAAMVIDWVAQRESTDLIMMPTKGLGRFRRLLLGSVAAKVLHDVSCPVWTSAHEPTMFTSGQLNKHRALRQGAGQILRLVPLSNGCKRPIAVAPRSGRRNSNGE